MSDRPSDKGPNDNETNANEASDTKKVEFWSTLPGILTGAAALITAIVGLIALIPSLRSPQPDSTSPSIHSPSPQSASASPDVDNLTGVWRRSDDSTDATYYIRQVNSKIWWYGDGPGYSVVSHGTWDEKGKKFRTNWADVPIPKKDNREFGQSTISIIDPNQLQVTPDGRTEYYLIRKRLDK